jgi:MFS family permease
MALKTAKQPSNRRDRMIGLMFFGAIALWGLVAIGVGLGLSKLFKESWRGLAAFALIPLIFFAPVADEIIALPQMNALCATMKPLALAPGMDEAKAYGRTIYLSSTTSTETLFPPTIKVTRHNGRYVDAKTKEPVLVQSGFSPSAGMLGMPSGSGGGSMPLVLSKCPRVDHEDKTDTQHIPLRFSHLKLTVTRTP